MERKFEIWLDSGANIHSCKKTVVTLVILAYPRMSGMKWIRTKKTKTCVM